MLCGITVRCMLFAVYIYASNECFHFVRMCFKHWRKAQSCDNGTDDANHIFGYFHTNEGEGIFRKVQNSIRFNKSGKLGEKGNKPHEMKYDSAEESSSKYFN
jgi:hypothetical protein